MPQMQLLKINAPTVFTAEMRQPYRWSGFVGSFFLGHWRSI